MTVVVPYAATWLPFDIMQPSPNTNTLDYTTRMASIRRGVVNFVRIMTGRDIPVKFSSGKQSYSIVHDVHGNSQEQIVLSASDDPSKIDVSVGIALHEAAHIIWSQRNHTYTIEPQALPLFEFLYRYSKQQAAIIPTELIDQGKRLGFRDVDVFNDVKTMLNIIEDRRIDQLMYQRTYGYRPYYEAMYAELWQSRENYVLLNSAQSKIPTVTNYFYHIGNMTNEGANPDALPALRTIWELIDIPNLNRFVPDRKWYTWASAYEVSYSPPGISFYPFDVLPDMIQTAIRIIEHIYTNAIVAPVMRDSEVTIVPTEKPTNDLDNLDVFDHSTQERIKKLTKKFLNQVNGTYDKQEINKHTNAQIDALDDSNAEIKECGNDLGLIKKPKVIIYHKLSQALINSSAFPFSFAGTQLTIDTDLVNAINEGYRLGKLLATKVQVIADEALLKYTRQSHGQIDKRMLAGLGYGAERIFSHNVLERYDPILVHLSVDSSGSMQGSKWVSAIRLCATLAELAEQIKTLDLVISFRSSGDNGQVHVLLAYDSRIDQFIKIRQLFSQLAATGGTPEGLAFEAIRDLIITDSTKLRRFFVNISDGEPAFSWTDDAGADFSYQGASAWAHTAAQVRGLHENNIDILSYFLSHKTATEISPAFRTMYGKTAALINPSSVIDIARTLNRLFLSTMA